MTLAEAYDYIDLLLDKADQPYFTNVEKDRFLELALTEWINQHYHKMETDEDSRRALAPLTDWQGMFELTDAEIAAGDTLEDKYPLSTGTDKRGYFVFGSQYVIPRQHLYTLAVRVRYVGESNTVSAKSFGAKDRVSTHVARDPFNKTDNENPSYYNIENRIVVGPGSDIQNMVIVSITVPELTELFDDASAGTNYRWIDHHQRELVQIAARKMAGNIESSNYDVYQREVENNM